MTVSAILLDAANLIERHGWIQGAYGRPDRGYCLFGAVFEASKYDSDNPWAALVDQEVTGGDPIGWNDAEGRTREQVIGLLRSAAESAA